MRYTFRGIIMIEITCDKRLRQTRRHSGQRIKRGPKAFLFAKKKKEEEEGTYKQEEILTDL